MSANHQPDYSAPAVPELQTVPAPPPEPVPASVLFCNWLTDRENQPLVPFNRHGFLRTLGSTNYVRKPR